MNTCTSSKFDTPETATLGFVKKISVRSRLSPMNDSSMIRLKIEKLALWTAADWTNYWFLWGRQ